MIYNPIQVILQLAGTVKWIHVASSSFKIISLAYPSFSIKKEYEATKKQFRSIIITKYPKDNDNILDNVDRRN